MDIKKQIAVYGDSILKGVMLDKVSKRYYLQKESIDNKIEEVLPVNIKNNSKFGCTIKKGYKQLQSAFDSGLNYDIVLLEYGGNDCDYNWEEVSEKPDEMHFPHTTIDVFEQTLRKMIKELKEHGIKPLMMSLPPIDGQKYFNWFTRNGLNKENILKFLGDIQMIYRFQELYSDTVTKIAKETNSLFIDVRSRFLDKRNFSNLICEDGIHPNPDGQKIINEAIIDFAQDNRI